ncbi:DUF2567 domain-containing protein [Kitasatospora sp. NPDC094015]|uniref:DUF2567 domain-containing protein n=1 Tax=Kitasatospora sp. NPDC094015 TaxID=3155205 RepID=UPI0033261E86
MTVPNTPAGADAGPARDPYAPPPAGGPTEPAGRSAAALLSEGRVGALTFLACAVLGVLMGLLWFWLAPRVMFQVSGNQILYMDPEGEQRAGADAVFALLGLGAGLLTAVGAFLLTRGRGGGIAVAVGLALGGLAGSVAAWQLGAALGPTSDLPAHARQVGDGGTFSAPLELGAHGALLVWPMTAMVLLLALSAAFGKREPDPLPYWATGPQWSLSGEPGAPGEPAEPARPQHPGYPHQDQGQEQPPPQDGPRPPA